MELVENISPFCRLSFCPLMVPFVLHKLLSFMRSNLLFVDLNACDIVILFKKALSVLIHSRLFPNSFSVRISMSGFMFMVFDLLGLEFYVG